MTTTRTREHSICVGLSKQRTAGNTPEKRAIKTALEESGVRLVRSLGSVGITLQPGVAYCDVICLKNYK